MRRHTLQDHFQRVEHNSALYTKYAMDPTRSLNEIKTIKDKLTILNHTLTKLRENFLFIQPNLNDQPTTTTLNGSIDPEGAQPRAD